MAFPETNWSLLAAASLHGGGQDRRALSELCSHYWQPVFSAIRGWGYGEEESRDYTQGFFEHLLTHPVLRRADREQGKFRTFVLTVLWRYLNDIRKKLAAEKRWGGQQRLPWDPEAEEVADPGDEAAFTRLLDYGWACTLLQRTMAVMEDWIRKKHGAAAWELMRRFLPGSPGVPEAAELAALLSLSLPGTRTEIHRLRSRFREVLRRQILATVSSPEEVDEEIRYLGQVLRSRP